MISFGSTGFWIRGCIVVVVLFFFLNGSFFVGPLNKGGPDNAHGIPFTYGISDSDAPRSLSILPCQIKYWVPFVVDLILGCAIGYFVSGIASKILRRRFLKNGTDEK